MVEAALAAPDPAKIEPEHGETALREHVEELVDDLVVHRPAELRVGMENDGDRSVLLLGGLETPLKATGGAGEDHFWHRASSSFWIAARLACLGRSRPDPSGLPPPRIAAGGAAAFISQWAGLFSSGLGGCRSLDSGRQ